MLAGVVIAILEHRGVSVLNRASPLAFMGLTLCVGSFFLCNHQSTVPGPLAAIPVLGTALLIWSRMGGEGSYLSRISTWGPIRYLGRLSYSLYLLHWPILVFEKFNGTQSPWAALGTTFLLAVTLHHTIENPIRACHNPVLLRRMLRGGLFLGALLLGFSKWVRIREGFVNAPAQSWFESVLPDAQKRRVSKTSLVPMGATGGVPEVLLVGDSHAESLFREVDKGLKSIGKSGAFWWAPGTFPGKGVLTSVYSSHFDRDLPALAQGPWDTVIICSNWRGYLDFQKTSLAPKLKNPFLTNDEAFSIIEGGLVDAIRSFGPRRIVLIDQIPRQNWDVPTEMARWLMHGKSLPEGWIPEESARQDSVQQLMNRVKAQCAVIIVEPISIFSKNGYLRYQEGLQSLYRDAGHLSDRGARELVPSLFKQLEPPLGAPKYRSSP